MKISLFWKLLVLCFVLVFTASLSQHIFLRFLSSSQALRHLYLQQWQQTHMQQALQQQLSATPLELLPPETVASAFAPYVLNHGYNIDYQQLPYLKLTIDTLAVVDRQGQLITQLGNSIYQPGNLFTQMTLHGREDLVEALIGKDPFGTSTLPDYPGVVVAISLFDSRGEIVGAIVSHQQRQLAPGSNGIWFGIKMVTQGMFQAQADFIANLIIASLVFALVITFYLRKRITKITASVKQWKNANFGSSIDDLSSDELGQCAKALNDMSLSLENAMLQAQQNASYKERLELASALHDTVKQRLFAVNLKVGIFEKHQSAQPTELPSSAPNNALVKDITTQCQLAYEELEQVISALQPPVAVQFSELESHCSHQHTTAGLTVCFAIDSQLAKETVPPLALRLINEGLQNTVKHAQASHCTITVATDSGILDVDICDDGIGIPVDEEQQLFRSSQGLALLRQSIIDAGGNLTINGNKGPGFSLHGRIPFPVPTSGSL